MKLSELITAYGDDRIEMQNLDAVRYMREKKLLLDEMTLGDPVLRATALGQIEDFEKRNKMQASMT